MPQMQLWEWTAAFGVVEEILELLQCLARMRR